MSMSARRLTALFDTTAALGAVDNRGEVLAGPIPPALGDWVNAELELITFDMEAATAIPGRECVS